MSSMKPRFKEHDSVNQVVRDDWIYSISIDPNHFEALLYLPTEKKAIPEDDLYEKPVHLQLDENQKEHGYALPFIIPVLDNPTPLQGGYQSDQSGEDGAGDDGEIIIMKIGHDPVPVGAILEWEESLHDKTTRRVWWYVHSAKTIGTTKAGILHYLIPCRDFASVISEGSNE